MPEPRPISPVSNHEELFIQRYQWLIYQSAGPSEGQLEIAKLDHRLLSHIVSCATCLDGVNAQRGPPPFSQA
jgi:hypothetical protein